MNGRRSVLLLVVALAAVVIWIVVHRGAGTPILDLVPALPDARQQPASAAFEVSDVAIGGRTLRSIVAAGPTRLTFHVTPPRRAWFRVDVAIAPRVWTAPGDPVRFFVGVSDGHSYREAASAAMAPRDRAGDRRWQEVLVNLEEYAGLTIDLVLNTRVGADPQNGFAVWGAPAVVLR